MTKSEAEKRLKKIDKEILMAGIIDSPGAIMVGLAIYAIFGANGDAFLPFLNDQTVAYSLLGVGGVIMLWGAIRVVTLSLEKKRLMEKHEL